MATEKYMLYDEEGTRDFVYLLPTIPDQPSHQQHQISANHPPEIPVLPKIQGQTEVGKILQKTPNKSHMPRVSWLPSVGGHNGLVRDHYTLPSCPRTFVPLEK